MITAECGSFVGTHRLIERNERLKDAENDT